MNTPGDDIEAVQAPGPCAFAVHPVIVGPRPPRSKHFKEHHRPGNLYESALALAYQVLVSLTLHEDSVRVNYVYVPGGPGSSGELPSHGGAPRDSRTAIESMPESRP